MHVELLLEADAEASVGGQLRCLQLIHRQVGRLHVPLPALEPDVEPAFEPLDSLELGAERLQTWEEAVERALALPACPLARLLEVPLELPVELPGGRSLEPRRGPSGQVEALLLRTSQPLRGRLRLTARQQAAGVFRLGLEVENLTPLAEPAALARAQAQRYAFASTHALLCCPQPGPSGGFVSLTEPPPALAEAVASCAHDGAWPALVGAPGSRDRVLVSPLIVGDYPKVAAASAGDLYDGTEIDEMLTLRIMTLTEDEKRAMASLEPRTRALLQRTEALDAETRLGLHGVLAAGAAEPGPRTVSVDGVVLGPGDRVRLRPCRRADLFDIVLAGKLATIEKVEQDFEDRIHLAVTIDDDPGRELDSHKQIGHRFFFGPEEVEPLARP